MAAVWQGWMWFAWWWYSSPLRYSNNDVHQFPCFMEVDAIRSHFIDKKVTRISRTQMKLLEDVQNTSCRASRQSNNVFRLRTPEHAGPFVSGSFHERMSTSPFRAEKGRAVKRAVRSWGGLSIQCVMRRKTGTSAPSALPVQLMAAKNLLSTNRKLHFLSLFLSYQ